MRTYLLKITSPEGDIFSDNVAMLSVRGTEGNLAIMAGHIPFVSYVKPCDAKILFENGEEKVGTLSGGVLVVSPEKTILLSGDFSWKEE